MGIALEELTNLRQVGHKQEVNQVDVQRPSANVLQRHAHDSKLGEILLVVAEVHEGDGQQAES